MFTAKTEDVLYSMNCNKLLFGIVISILLIGIVSAESIGTFKKDSDVMLYQLCNNCTYCNFSEVRSPDATLITDVVANQRDTYFYYNLSGGNTSTLGEYTYCYDCGNSADRVTGCLEFMINSTGEEFNLIQGFMLLGQFAMICLFVTLGIAFPRERWKLISFFFMIATGMGVVLLNSTRIIAAQSTTLNTMGNVGLYIGIIALTFLTAVLLVYFTIDVIDTLKRKKARRWI